MSEFEIDEEDYNACDGCGEPVHPHWACCNKCGATQNWAKPLRELITEAQDALSTFKNPDICLVEDRLDALLMAANMGSIKHDRIESLSFFRGMLNIRTSYLARGCMQDGEYAIPEAVIDAEDPFTAIKVWAKEQRIKKAESEVRLQRSILQSAEERLAKALIS